VNRVCSYDARQPGIVANRGPSPASIYRGFVADPGNLQQENTSCASRVTPVHTVGAYPGRLAGVTPAAPAPGNAADRSARQAAVAALASAADELSRFELLDGNRDRGLRGGTVTFSAGHGLLARLHGVRWVSDARTSGTARWDPATDQVTARLTVRYRGGTVRLTARWLLFAAQDQPAVITGMAGSRRLGATMPAP
jgi:hypothetical protein